MDNAKTKLMEAIEYAIEGYMSTLPSHAHCRNDARRAIEQVVREAVKLALADAQYEMMIAGLHAIPPRFHSNENMYKIWSAMSAIRMKELGI